MMPYHVRLFSFVSVLLLPKERLSFLKHDKDSVESCRFFIKMTRKLNCRSFLREEQLAEMTVTFETCFAKTVKSAKYVWTKSGVSSAISLAKRKALMDKQMTYPGKEESEGGTFTRDHKSFVAVFGWTGCPEGSRDLPVLPALP